MSEDEPIKVSINENGKITEGVIKEMKLEIIEGKARTTYIIGSRKTDDILTEVIEYNPYLGMPVTQSEIDRWHEEQMMQPRQEQEALDEYNAGDDVIDAMSHALEEFDGYCKPREYAMDKEYPHTCFSCGKKIYYMHALGNALPIMRGEKSRKEGRFVSPDEDKDFKKQFKKWWQSDIVKFVCCSCHKNPEKIEKFIKKRERLLRQAHNRAKKYKYEVEF